MIPAAIRVLPCLLVFAFAAGCSSTTTVETEEETAEESDVTEAKVAQSSTKKTQVARLEEPKAECTNVPAPTCADGESLRMGVDADGCLVPRCTAVCTSKPAPTCGTGEVLRTATDASGCSVSYCFTE